MSETPSDPNTPPPTSDSSQGAPPEPFVRGRIVWGRPPETVFRTGPLPRAPQSWAQPNPRPVPPRPRPGPSILSGSMVPGTAPGPAGHELPPVPETPTSVVATPEAEPQLTLDVVLEPLVEQAPEPEIEAEAEPVGVPVEEQALPELVAELVSEPLPEASVEMPPVIEPVIEAAPEAPAAEERGTTSAPEPGRTTGRGRSTVEIIVEPEAPEQIDTVPPLSTGEAGPADPRAIPSVVVTPTLYARVEAVVDKVKKNDRWLIAAAVGAVVVTGGFIWLATLPSGDAPPLDMDAPPPAAPGAEALLPAEAEPAAATEVPSLLVTEVETPTAPAARSEPAPVTVRPPTAIREPVPTPRVAAPLASEPAEAPAIEPAPLVVEPPTTATPAPTDPNAPIETRPQPLE